LKVSNFEIGSLPGTSIADNLGEAAAPLFRRADPEVALQVFLIHVSAAWACYIFGTQSLKNDQKLSHPTTKLFCKTGSFINFLSPESGSQLHSKFSPMRALKVSQNLTWDE
jgi:hypothetical protein